MTATIHDVAGRTVLRVEGDLTIFEAGEFQRTLADSTISREELIVNLGATDSIDGAGVQVLLSLQKKVEVLGVAFSVGDVSDAVRETLQLMGLVEHFQLPVDGARHD